MTPAFGLHLVTLGVADLARATAFYEGMGLKQRDTQSDGVAFFDAGGVVLSLFPRAALTADAGLSPAAGGGAQDGCGIALAFNVAGEAAVEEVVANAALWGAKVLKAPQRAFWGGYSAYFADLDGHIWEVAHNPFWPLDDRGRPTLPD